MIRRVRETCMARAERIRPRILDCLHDMGHGDPQKGKERFVEHALWVASQHNVRVWQGDRHMQKRAAMFSLASILGENVYAKWDTRKTAGNVHWVMDIWELACDDWFRVKPAEPEEVEQMAALEAASPAAVATMVGPPARRLSARILDAYLNRDADAMLTALGELEEIERERERGL